MTVASSDIAAALEARQAGLRRQIAVVAALILALSIALAASALLPRSRSPGASSNVSAVPPAAAPTAGGAPQAVAVTEGTPPPGDERASNLGSAAPATPPAATGGSASAVAPHYVELGTYVEPAKVDALRERLEQHQFRTLLETRMRIGPFATRDQAQAAQARLSELGFAPGAVVAEKP